MSKKSRRRNRRLLMMAALMGGVGMMGRGKKMSGKETVSDAQKAHNFASDAAVTGITKPTAPADNVVKNITKPDTSGSPIRTRHRITDPAGNTISPSPGKLAQIMQAKANAPKGVVRPGNYTPPVHPRIPRGLAYGQQMFKKGGSVKKAKATGIAKRGFGRALMKGKK